MRMVQACLCAVKTSIRRFNLRGGTLKHVEASLSATDDRESSFHHWRPCEVGASLFLYGKDLIKQF